ncbi:MAG: hypothetical protein ABSE08_10080 [Syntrophobacteraceae bacterium]|jgi:hypothetical protein
MKLFCFASRNIENIWIGVKARKWAVATTSASDMKGRRTKAERYLEVGDRGVLYCNPTHSFTTPFIIQSKVDYQAVVTDVWSTSWVFPFDILPLGNPSRQLSMDFAKKRWPILIRSTQASVSAAMNITGTTVFVPNYIDDEQWKQILADLGITN